MTDLPHDLVVAFELVELERTGCVYCAMKLELLVAGRAIPDDEVQYPRVCPVRAEAGVGWTDVVSASKP